MHGRPAPEPDRAGRQRGARALRRPGLRRPTIPRNVRLSEAPSHGKPILLYDVASKGAKSYLALAREFLARQAERAERGGARRDGSGLMSGQKRKALGRGLAALIPGAPAPAEAAPAPAAPRSEAATGAALRTIGDRGGAPLARAAAHALRRRAPRRAGGVDPRRRAIIQPLVVRGRGDGGGYELIAGERRWRAAQRAGLHEVPVVVRDVAADAGVRARAGREPAARGPEPDRGGRGLPAPGRRVRLHAGAAGRAGRQGPQHGRQRAPPAQAAGRGARAGRRGAAVDGPRARAARARDGRGDRAAARRRSSPRSCRCARSRSWCGASATASAPARRPADGGARREVGERARSRAAAVARARHAGRGRRGGRRPGRDRHPLPLARSARRAARAPAALMSGAS